MTHRLLCINDTTHAPGFCNTIFRHVCYCFFQSYFLCQMPIILEMHVEISF